MRGCGAGASATLLQNGRYISNYSVKSFSHSGKNNNVGKSRRDDVMYDCMTVKRAKIIRMSC